MTNPRDIAKRLRGLLASYHAHEIDTSEVDRRCDEAADTIDELVAALEGMMREWDKFTRYGSPLAKQANENVQRAARALADKPTEGE